MTSIPASLATVCDLVVSALKREPDREFSTKELADKTMVEAKFLAQIGPYFAPFAKRGVERPGFGQQANRMVRPFLWSYPDDAPR